MMLHQNKKLFNCEQMGIHKLSGFTRISDLFGVRTLFDFTLYFDFTYKHCLSFLCFNYLSCVFYTDTAPAWWSWDWNCRCFVSGALYLKRKRSFPTASECSTEVARDSSPPPPSSPSRASPRACARRWRRAHGRCRGVVLAPALSALWPQWQLRLTALRLPLRHAEPALSPSCLSVSLALLSGSLPLALVSGFFPQEQAEVPPGRRFCPTRPDCCNPRTAVYEPIRSRAAAAAWTRVPPPLLPPPPPRRGRPRPTLFLRPDKKKPAQKAPHDEGRATFPLCFELRRERGRAERGRRGGKREIPDTKPSVRRWLVIYEEEQEVSAVVLWHRPPLGVFFFKLLFREQSSGLHGPFFLCTVLQAAVLTA